MVAKDGIDETSSTKDSFEMLIIGAGIAGINAAYRYQSKAPRGESYAVFEARDSLGGTWDLFRYPGIRSDSDIFTFSFEWNPWRRKGTLASGVEIKEYLMQSVQKHGIDAHIRYRHKVVSLDWNPKSRQWDVYTLVGGEKSPRVCHSRFVYLATGYYDYHEPLKANIPGIGDFEGKVIHPQFWPKNYDYSNQKMVVIGSGATAVTIVPSVTEQVEHVTMLQRSPTYIFPLAQFGTLSAIVFFLFPQSIAYALHRIGWILQTFIMIQACKAWPGLSRRYIRYESERLLPHEVPWNPHFNPRYNPWEQRLCAAKDGDIYTALRSGKASVVTDTIETITKRSIKLKSGAELDADIIVTATGLRLQFAGGIQVSVDGKVADYASAFLWKGTMLQDVPNLFFTIGFENAAWTLGCDCAAQLMVRMLQRMNSNNAKVAIPRIHGYENMVPKPLLSLMATYLQSVNQALPKGGTGVWAPRSNYVWDMLKTRYGDIETGMELS
ncbi:hypothetical protein PWT90_07034 [Aphanocladium album]|nr:hypothetical protein PWT90_07034 [Aphanocladium album]